MQTLSRVASYELSLMLFETMIQQQWKQVVDNAINRGMIVGECGLWTAAELQRVWLAKQAWRAAREIDRPNLDQNVQSRIINLVRHNPFFEAARHWRLQKCAPRNFSQFAHTVLSLRHKTIQDVYDCGMHVDRVYGVAKVGHYLPPPYMFAQKRVLIVENASVNSKKQRLSTKVAATGLQKDK